jgi:hypothetical protein
MAVDSTVTGSGIDLNNLFQSAITGGNMGNIFGGNDGSGGFVMGALLGRLLLNPNGNDLNGNGSQNADRAAIDAAVSAALANSNQANNNAMLLLKDIQDSSQEVVSAINASENAINATVNATAQTALVQQLQAQIANLQGQGEIKAVVAASTGTIVNELHESTQQIGNQLDGITVSMLNGFNNVTREITNDGDKTRALITANMVTDLNNQIADLRTQRAVADNGVTVTNNINQNQLQQQQQQQLGYVVNALNGVVSELQRNTQSVVNLGTMSGSAGSQTANNTRVNG